MRMYVIWLVSKQEIMLTYRREHAAQQNEDTTACVAMWRISTGKMMEKANCKYKLIELSFKAKKGLEEERNFFKIRIKRLAKGLSSSSSLYFDQKFEEDGGWKYHYGY